MTRSRAEGARSEGTSAEAATAATRPRTMSRTERRAQLIEATIATLARLGYARTTLTAVARTAGLSHGLVLFHFETKEKLLTETLDFLSEEYSANWQAALAAAEPTPEDGLAALVRADFNPVICTPERLAAWCAYWGESQSRPIYQARCGANDAEYNATLERLCEGMNARHGYDHHPVRTARMLRVLLEGLWLELMTIETPYPVEEAMVTVWTALAALFPRHFTTEGPAERPQDGPCSA